MHNPRNKGYGDTVAMSSEQEELPPLPPRLYENVFDDPIIAEHAEQQNFQSNDTKHDLQGIIIRLSLNADSVAVGKFEVSFKTSGHLFINFLLYSYRRYAHSCMQTCTWLAKEVNHQQVPTPLAVHVDACILHSPPGI